MVEFKAFASSSEGNLYTLDDGKTRIIIDLGLPIARIKQALNFKLSNIFRKYKAGYEVREEKVLTHFEDMPPDHTIVRRFLTCK